MGRRIHKTSPNGNVQFVYDESGHLLGEYDDSGNLIEEMVYLGDVPVATLRPNGAGGITAYYVHTDHLNTIRKISRSSDNLLVWRGDSDPFGNTPANQNPSGLGTFVSNLGFPGQYLDVEVGTYYNYFRDYNPATGRYIESDPIGLAGGGYSTYAYANGNPISESDPFGLWGTDAHNAILQYAFPNLTWGQLQALENGSVSVDALWNQGPSNAYQHAMTAPGQSVADAQAKMCAFVASHLATYESLQGSSSPSAQYDAYYALGQALHPIMDSTSPAHAGWQVWYNPAWPGNWGEIPNHGDGSDSLENLAHLTIPLLQETVTRMQQAINGGGQCSCGGK
jgi:RHS repeat-associated protein